MAEDYTTSPYSQGDRSALIAVTASFVNGGTLAEDVDGTIVVGNGWYWNELSQDNTGEWIQWVFDAPQIVVGIQRYMGNSTSSGSWKMQAWDGAAWVDLSSPFTWGGTATWERLWSNATAYDTYRLLGVGGDRVNGGTWQEETWFKISDGVPPEPEGAIDQLMAGFSQIAEGSGGESDEEEDTVLIIIN